MSSSRLSNTPAESTRPFIEPCCSTMRKRVGDIVLVTDVTRKDERFEAVRLQPIEGVAIAIDGNYGPSFIKQTQNGCFPDS